MTPTPQPKALELADQLAVRKGSNWVHGTGETPRRNGFRADTLCAEAAAELRRQHAEIEALRIDSIACRAAIEHALQLVEDFAASPEGDDDMSQGAARATRRQLNEAIGKMSPRLMYERDGPKPMYSLHYKELRDERDSLRAEVEREREARRAAQIRQEELTEEVVRLEPMRQRAADIERLTAEVERLERDVQGLKHDHTAALGLVADIRQALGDNGSRMQDELIEWCKGLRADAERYRAVRTGLHYTIKCGDTRIYCGGHIVQKGVSRDAYPEAFDAAIDAAREAKSPQNNTTPSQ